MFATTVKRVRRSLRGCRPRLSLKLCLFEEEYCLDLFGFLIALPIFDRWVRDPHECMEAWGIYWENDNPSIVLNWGRHCKFIHMPWRLEHYKSEVRRADGTWTKKLWSFDKDCPNEGDGRELFEFPYRYTLRSGEVQERTATVFVDRMEWRRKWHMWTPLFGKVRICIDVHFSDEVGERTGSWKGGCIGCGYEMLPGETAEQTLRRMEVERVFD